MTNYKEITPEELDQEYDPGVTLNLFFVNHAMTK
jgi:hypothetical protein